MLRIEENRDEVIIGGGAPLVSPRAVIAGLAAGVFITFMISLLLDTAGWNWVIFPVAAVAAFLLIQFFDPSIAVKISKSGRTVSVRRQSLVRYDFKVYSFSEIGDRVYVEKTNAGRSSPLYRLMMPLKDGNVVELSEFDTQSDRPYNAVQIVNDCIFDTPEQIPFRLTFFEDD